MKIRRDIFQAIADPNRRAIINLLKEKPLNLNAVAGNFDISRPAVSKHIRILRECGVIKITQKGRERFCEANFDILQDVITWAVQYEQFWTKKPVVLPSVREKASPKVEEPVIEPAKAQVAQEETIVPEKVVVAAEPEVTNQRPAKQVRKKESSKNEVDKKENSKKDNTNAESQLALF